MKYEEMPYSRIDFAEETRYLKELMKRFQAAKSAEEQFAVHQEYYKMARHIQTEMTLASTRNSLDTSDAFYDQEKDYYDREYPAYSNLAVEYAKLLLKSPFRKELEEIIGHPAFRNMELAEKSTSEAIIPLKQEENALVSRYEKMMASAAIEWEGQIYNISQMTPFQRSKDRKVRQEAGKKVDAFYASKGKELDEIYDALVKNRTAQAKALGYENFTELGYNRMIRNSYRRPEVEKFRSQIKEYWVPLAEEFWDNRRKRLGLDKLYFCDEGVSFPEGSPKPIGSYEDTLLAGQKMYRELSEKTGEFFDFMLDDHLLQVLPGKHKKVGGYMTYMPDFHSPFVFANFNGTSGDVDVITHECGHAFQGYLTADDPILEHADITMETAETHSMSMEFFTNPWMNLFFGDRADDFKKSQVEDAVAFIPYGCMVDEFQHIVYDHPEMTPAERKEAWKGLEKVYKPHLDFGEEYPFFGTGSYWQRQNHIYAGPFYYIDYCIAQTSAFQYRIWMEKDYRAAFDSYLKFSRESGSGFYAEMLEENGLKSPFNEGTIQEIVKGIRELL